MYNDINVCLDFFFLLYFFFINYTTREYNCSCKGQKMYKSTYRCVCLQVQNGLKNTENHL